MCFADRPQKRHDISDVIEMENKIPNKPLQYRETMMTETFTVSIYVLMYILTEFCMLGLVPQLEMRGSYALLFQMLILPNGEEICMACKLYSYVLVFQIMF